MRIYLGTISVFPIVLTLLILTSCKEEDHSIQVPNYFLAMPSKVTIARGDTARVHLSGGVPPYEIARPPKANIAFAELSRDTLTIIAVGFGSETVALKDTSTPVQTLSISIQVQ